MRKRSIRILALGAAAIMLMAQTPPAAPSKPAAPTQQRDIQFEDEARPPEQKRDLKPAQGSEAPVTIPRSYALVIGVSHYENLPAAAQLKYAERDAESIYSVLISTEGGNFKAENVHRLVGPRATLANIKKELEGWLPFVSRPEDRVLVYFAGHGFVHHGKAYLAPYDIDPERIDATGYPMDELGSVIRQKIKGKVEDAAHRCLPQRRHHAGRRRQAHQPALLGPGRVAVLPDRQPRPRALFREPRLGRRPRHLHVLCGQGHGGIGG